ncbi:MAG TPA: hypothetical protein ENK18_21190 [Deltaproteobacteria bacterium]|nr:hypothetical protein [Deltaproteobacteria bacterium]
MRGFPDSADRLLVIFSDVEMGAGGVLDDFPHSDWLSELMLSYTQGPTASLALDLVFNGDTFDLLKTSIEGHYPRYVTEEVALAKLERVIAAHPDFFTGIRTFLEGAHVAPRRVHFVVGNHDAELVFPAVQRRIASLIGVEGVHFAGFDLDIGDVHIEHGNQGDPMFAVDPARPIIEWRDQVLLDLPWGSTTLIDVVLPLQPLLYPLDRVRPRTRVFELLPEVKDLLANAFWRYWTREYLYGVLQRSDPTWKISWTMLKEVMYRFSTFDPETSGVPYKDLLRREEHHRVTVVGHHHQPAWWSWGDRKVLQAGCLRNEYVLGHDGAIESMLPKVYAEVAMSGDRAVRSHLVEIDGPAAPGHMPASLNDLRAQALPLLAPAEERAQLQLAEQAQIAREAEDGSEG